MDTQFLNWIFSGLLAIISIYVKAVSARLDKAETKVEQLNNKILESYHPKNEVAAMVIEIKALLRESINEVRLELRELKEQSRHERR